VTNKSNHRRIFYRAVFGFACLLGAATPVLAQQRANPAAEKWRPTDGLYAAPGAGFSASCDQDSDHVLVDLNENEINGHEWGCTVTKLTDAAPGVIRLNMTCDDYNLAESLGDRDPNYRKFKETMLLRKDGDTSMFVRKTSNGKFRGAAWRAAYCPVEAQRAYRDQIAKEHEEAAQKAEWERKAAEECKAIEERSRPKATQ
jgi:hypothetical protein